jgi:hypothetical protein
MSTKPESQFITSIHKHLDPSVYRMKNHNPYVAGVPDCYYSGYKQDMWVEYKYKPIGIPKMQVIPELTKLQLRWIEGRQEEGRTVWVIQGTKNGGVIYNRYEDMVAGFSPVDFLSWMMDRKQLANMICAYVGARYGNH